MRARLPAVLRGYDLNFPTSRPDAGVRHDLPASQRIGADWVYCFPELGIVELEQFDEANQGEKRYFVSEAAAAELDARRRRAEIQRFRTELAGNGRNVRGKRLWTGRRRRSCGRIGRCTAAIPAVGRRRDSFRRWRRELPPSGLLSPDHARSQRP